MIDLILWFAVVAGVTCIVTRSNLLDPIRLLINNFCKETKYVDISQTQVGLVFKPNTLLIVKLFDKLINCWICVSFWTGWFLTMFFMGPLNIGLFNGFAAVGLMSLYQFYLDAMSSK